MKRTEIAVACRRGHPIRYALLTTIGEDGSPRYGVAVACSGEESMVQDVTSSLPKLLTLIFQLRQGCVMPAGVHDVVEDWLLR